MHELTIMPEAWICFKILCLIGDTRHSHIKWQMPTVRIREARNSEGARSSGTGRDRDASTWKVCNSSHENNWRRRAAAMTDAGHCLGPSWLCWLSPAQGQRWRSTACEEGERAGPDQIWQDQPPEPCSSSSQQLCISGQVDPQGGLPTERGGWLSCVLNSTWEIL